MTKHSASIAAYSATILRHRDLIAQLVRREFFARYRGSMLGAIWAVINPLATVLVFTFVFGVVFESRWDVQPSSKTNFVIIVLVGMIVHGILAEALARAPNVIVGQPAYVKKVIFPLEILPIITTLSASLNAAIALAVVLIFNGAINNAIHITLIFLPAVLFPYLLFIGGLVLLVSALGVYLRDLSQIAGLLSLSALFLAPIFYPISAVPEDYRFILYLNPLTFTVEQVRAVSLYGRPPNWLGLTVYALIAFVFVWLGFCWFQRARRGFADVI